MTAPGTPTPPRPTLTSLTQLPPDLEEQLACAQGRRDKKIKDSALGFVIVLVGIAVLALAGYLAIEKTDWKVLAGAAGVGILFVFTGGLVADKETFWPVVRGIVAVAVTLIKARKS